MLDIQIKGRDGTWTTIASAPSQERLASSLLSGVAIFLFLAVLLGWCVILWQ